MTKRGKKKESRNLNPGLTAWVIIFLQTAPHKDMATAVSEAAIANGTAPTAPVLDPVPAPAGAEVDVGGKKCKWCGSTTHQRKSHKDCPYNSTS